MYDSGTELETSAWQAMASTCTAMNTDLFHPEDLVSIALLPLVVPSGGFSLPKVLLLSPTAFVTLR